MQQIILVQGPSRWDSVKVAQTRPDVERWRPLGTALVDQRFFFVSAVPQALDGRRLRVCLPVLIVASARVHVIAVIDCVEHNQVAVGCPRSG